jgi:hypothetical protein
VATISRHPNASESAGKRGLSLCYPSGRLNGPAFRLVTAEAERQLTLNPVCEAIWLAAEEILSAEALIQRVRCALRKNARAV